MKMKIFFGMLCCYFMSYMVGVFVVMIGFLLVMGYLVCVYVNIFCKNCKSVILFWMGGGFLIMDIWDFKFGVFIGGEFCFILISGDV